MFPRPTLSLVNNIYEVIPSNTKDSTVLPNKNATIAAQTSHDTMINGGSHQ